MTAAQSEQLSSVAVMLLGFYPCMCFDLLCELSNCFELDPHISTRLFCNRAGAGESQPQQPISEVPSFIDCFSTAATGGFAFTG